MQSALQTWIGIELIKCSHAAPVDLQMWLEQIYLILSYFELFALQKCICPLTAAPITMLMGKFFGPLCVLWFHGLASMAVLVQKV